MVPASSVIGESTHDRISPDGNASKTTAGITRLQRVQKVSQTFSHPVRVLLGACAAGKSPKVVLIGCERRGREARQCLPVVLEDSQSCC